MKRVLIRTVSTKGALETLVENGAAGAAIFAPGHPSEFYRSFWKPRDITSLPLLFPHGLNGVAAVSVSSR